MKNLQTNANYSTWYWHTHIHIFNIHCVSEKNMSLYHISADSWTWIVWLQ